MLLSACSLFRFKIGEHSKNLAVMVFFACNFRLSRNFVLRFSQMICIRQRCISAILAIAVFKEFAAIVQMFECVCMYVCGH